MYMDMLEARKARGNRQAGKASQVRLARGAAVDARGPASGQKSRLRTHKPALLRGDRVVEEKQ